MGGEAISLRRKPMVLLHALMSKPGELVTKRELIELGWGDLPVTDAVLATAVKEIRRAVGDDARAPWAVENVHGRGYRFLLEVEQICTSSSDTIADGGRAGDGAVKQSRSRAGERLADESSGVEERAAGGADGTTSDHADTPLRAPGVTAPDRRRQRQGRAAVVALTLVAASVLVFLVARGPREAELTRDAVPSPPAGASESEASVSRPSIAVLPLADMSPGGDRAWFADGLTEEILNQLARSPDLLVASRTSAFRFRDDAADVREIGRDLGVDYVMEGSVRAAGERLRITVQLIRSDDGMHVFSESWDRPFALESVLGVQEEISRSVLMTLNASLTPKGEALRSIDGDATLDVQLSAYEDFLRGRELIRSRTREGLAEGMTLLQRSADAAADYAPTHAAIALGSLLSAAYFGMPRDEAVSRAVAHLRVATALSPESEEVLTASSLLAIFEGDMTGSLAYANAATRTAPSSAEAHYRRAVALINLGYLEEAFEAARRASLLDPLSPVVSDMLAKLYIAQGMPADAVMLARRVHRYNPDDPVAIGSLGNVLAWVGDYSNACRYLREAFEANPDSALTARNYADLLWRIGADEALFGSDQPGAWAALAAVKLELGQTDGAMELVNQYLNVRSVLLDGQDIAYWAGDFELARELARQRLVTDRLLEQGELRTYRDDYHQVVILLDGEAEAERMRAMLKKRFDGWVPPADATMLGADLFGAAAWRMLEGDPESALAWLEQAAARGYVLRELRLDPLFDPLREVARFNEVLAAMDATAALHRARVAEYLTLGPERRLDLSGGGESAEVL